MAAGYSSSLLYDIFAYRVAAQLAKILLRVTYVINNAVLYLCTFINNASVYRELSVAYPPNLRYIHYIQHTIKHARPVIRSLDWSGFASVASDT